MKYSSSCNCLLFLIHLPIVTIYGLFQNDIIRKFYSSIPQCYAVDKHRPLVPQKYKCQITFSIGQQISHMVEVVGLIFCSLSLLVVQYIYQKTADHRRVTWEFKNELLLYRVLSFCHVSYAHCSLLPLSLTTNAAILQSVLHLSVFWVSVMSAMHTAVFCLCRSQLTLPYRDLSFTHFSFTVTSASHTWLITQT
jgi:hypothetical protein